MRKRRRGAIVPKVLYTGDCNQFFYFAGLYDRRGLPTSIHAFMRLAARSGVDAYLCNPNAGLAFYPSRVVVTAFDGYRRGDREFFRAHVEAENATAAQREATYRFLTGIWDRYLDLLEQGVDWVQEVARACRRTGVAPWLSIRMNDMHGWPDLQRSHMNSPLLKNPRMRLPGRAYYPGKRFLPDWAKALNYALPEVRNTMFAMIRELVCDYDYEGIELDFLRNTALIEPVASETDISMVCDWIASIRELTLRQARKNGRPYPLGLRIPSHLVLLRERGLDVVRLARERLIDFVGVANWLQASWDIPYDQLREELGDILIYGGIDCTPNDLGVFNPRARLVQRRCLSTSAPSLYGNAATKWALGVDGVELFNFFGGDGPGTLARYSALRHLASPDDLRGRPKHYAFSSNLNLGSIEDAIENFPCAIRRGTRHAFRLPMLAEPAGRELRVQVIFERKPWHEFIGIAFNGGHPRYASVAANRFLFAGDNWSHIVTQPRGLGLSQLPPAYTSRVFRFNAEVIREGWNTVVLYYGDYGDHSAPDDYLTVVGLELAVGRERRR